MLLQKEKESTYESKPASYKRKGSASLPNMPSKRPKCEENVVENGVHVPRLSMDDMKDKIADMVGHDQATAKPPPHLASVISYKNTEKIIYLHINS